MRMLAAALLICSLPACGQARTSQPSPDRATAKADEPAIPPVLDAAAPTVAALERRGLVRTDDEPMGWSCGRDCTADGFVAIYMGREKARGAPDRQYVCPVASGEMESWKCRPVDPALASLDPAFGETGR